MQLSERWRRGVVVPLDDKALKAIRDFYVPTLASVIVAELRSDQDFYKLWRLGLFEDINETTGAYVDDYEEREVPADQVSRLLAVVQKFRRRVDLPQYLQPFLHDLEEVCRTAERVSMPVWFIL